MISYVHGISNVSVDSDESVTTKTLAIQAETVGQVSNYFYPTCDIERGTWSKTYLEYLGELKEDYPVRLWTM